MEASNTNDIAYKQLIWRDEGEDGGWRKVGKQEGKGQEGATVKF